MTSSGNFLPGQVGLLQLLGMSLLSCCRYHPAGMVQTLASLVCPCCLHLQNAGSASRPYSISRPPVRLLSLRPDNLLITHKMTLSIDFSSLVTLLAAIQATGLPAFTLTGLTPAEHTSLSWTYNMVRNFTTWGSQSEQFSAFLRFINK